ncbi:esterase/lipase family protein [Marinobacter sp.]|uniref:esterase/lipase family protein n=1 Tax=Marinobacter sp. TaxID=50741 RepID=UPI003850F517
MSMQQRNPVGWQDYTSAILNGFLGDWLEHRANPLAIEMQVLHEGTPVNPAQPGPDQARQTIVIMVHGLTELESIWDFPGLPGVHYGTLLSEFLGATPLSLRYNSGRPIHRNGEDLARTLETLIEHWPVPVEKVVLIGHSMGGLLIRSACHFAEAAGHEWTERVDSCVYLGCPHDGSWLATLAHGTAGRMRKQTRDYLKVIGEVLDLRSAGIRNLSRGDILQQEGEQPPLLANARHFAISGLLARQKENPVNLMFGDALVQENSARGGEQKGWELAGYACFPGINHIGLTRHPRVYQQLREWLE